VRWRYGSRACESVPVMQHLQLGVVYGYHLGQAHHVANRTVSKGVSSAAKVSSRFFPQKSQLRMALADDCRIVDASSSRRCSIHWRLAGLFWNRPPTHCPGARQQCGARATRLRVGLTKACDAAADISIAVCFSPSGSHSRERSPRHQSQRRERIRNRSIARLCILGGLYSWRNCPGPYWGISWSEAAGRTRDMQSVAIHLAARSIKTDCCRLRTATPEILASHSSSLLAW